MTYDLERELANRTSERQDHRPMIGERPSDPPAWVAAIAIAVVIGIVGYVYLQPELPSPLMRASEAPAAAPSSK